MLQQFTGRGSAPLARRAEALSPVPWSTGSVGGIDAECAGAAFSVEALEPGLVGGVAVEFWYRLATGAEAGLVRASSSACVPVLCTHRVGRQRVAPQPVPYDNGLGRLWV